MRALVPAAALTLLLLAGCGAAPPRPHPQASPTPTPPLPLGVLPLGGEVAAPLDLRPPFLVQGRLPMMPRTVPAAQTSQDPLTALQELVTALQVPGPAVNTGAGLSYNLGATTGYQLTSPTGYQLFNFHPNTPVDETGATPSVAAADAFVSQFLATSHLPYPHESLLPLPSLSVVNAADRRVFFQWAVDGYPLVNISGQRQEVYADVAANYRQQLSLVGLSGTVPPPISGPLAAYPPTTPDLMIQDLNQGLLAPGSYLLDTSGQPFPSPSPTAASTVVLISGASLGMVASAGYLVPVLVFQVSNQPPVAAFVTCAASTAACAPLRYSSTPPPPG